MKIRAITLLIVGLGCCVTWPQADAREHLYEYDWPRWSLDIKGGRLKPQLEEWKTFYGKDRARTWAVGLGYKITRKFEAGVQISSMRARGKGLLLEDLEPGGDVTYRLWPLHLSAIWRGVFNEDQILVPYFGGGYTHAFYQQDIRNQSRRRGSAAGYHVRVGLQILLDRWDTSAAANFHKYNGVNNTYFFIDFESFSAKKNANDLGGETVSLGLLFEF